MFTRLIDFDCTLIGKDGGSRRQSQQVQTPEINESNEWKLYQVAVFHDPTSGNMSVHVLVTWRVKQLISADLFLGKKKKEEENGLPRF